MRESVTKCAKLANVSRRTLQNYIKDGKISATLNDKGIKVIDLAELYRVFPDAMQDGKVEKEKENNRENCRQTEELEHTIEKLKLELEMVKKQLAKSEEREKDLMEISKSSARLLEHQAETISGNKRKKFLGIF